MNAEPAGILNRVEGFHALADSAAPRFSFAAGEKTRCRSRKTAELHKNSVILSLFLLVFLLSICFTPRLVLSQVDPDKRIELEQQLQQLEQEASFFDKNIQQVQGETRTLANELSVINSDIKLRELSIKRMALVIREAALQIGDKTLTIDLLSQKIDKSRKAIASGLFVLYANDQDNVLNIFLKNRNLSGFFGSLNNLEQVQSGIQEDLFFFKDEKLQLEKEKMELEDFRKEQQELKALQEVEKKFLAQKKKEKDEILNLTKGKEILFQQLLKLKKRDITSLKTQLFYLEKTGISAEDALRFANLAAKRAGIRPAFLLALLEVETGKQFEDGVISVGINLGTGNWEKDLYKCYLSLKKRGVAEAEKSAFFKITSKLNLDPDKMPVSRRPSYGCGGAMGPAQFLPTTWLVFEEKVAVLTGHNLPSPWNVEDAFTAAAIFLAEAGADSQTDIGEIRAAKTYISGSPSCRKYICRSYANRILSLAKDIDRIL